MGETILDSPAQLLLQVNATKSLTQDGVKQSDSAHNHPWESLMLGMTKFWGCLSCGNVMLCNQNTDLGFCRAK